MNQSTTVRYFITGGLREHRTAPSSRIPRLQAKYGDALTIISGNAPLQPAAVGTATLPAFGMQDIKSDIQAKQGARKRAVVEPEYNPDAEPVVVSAKKPATRKTLKGKYVKNLTTSTRTAIVCEKTSSYWPSIRKTVEALHVDHSDVRKHLNGERSHVGGHILREATNEERIAGMVIK